MKTIDNKLKSIALAAAFLFMGCATSAIAQVRTQQQERTQTQTQMQAQDQDDLDYDSMFANVDNTDQHDVLSLLRRDENFSMFVELLENSGLDNSLDAISPVTIFAPTNQAFQELTKEEYDRLTKSENKANLNRILQAHFLPRKVYHNEFQQNQTISTGNQEEINVETAGTVPTAGHMATVVIGGASIVKPDVEASNGIIHVVDGVIFPGDTRDPLQWH